MMGKILITGGAGYIGSHIAHEFSDNDYEVTILDNLSTGNVSLIPKNAHFFQGDFTDHTLLDTIFNDHKIDSVIHCAALIDAAESLVKPIEYYRENSAKTIELIAFCDKKNISKFLLSSTAAVYGNPISILVDEETYCRPVTPYGSSKLMAEQFIGDFSRVTSIKFGILRYFNVVGADPKGRTGQPNANSSSVFSSLCRAALGKQECFTIYGNDYDTPDGTCVRDFVHVSDLANAHRLTLEYLSNEKSPLLMNCGYGHGFSIMQLINTMETVLEKKMSYEFGARRNGDIVQIIACNDKMRKKLNWIPKYDSLNEMMSTALKWEETFYKSNLG
ncbi:MAG: UDP-glucose 4-epimerase GalE [Alphaproteobacteria bacterium]|nr:UDP-glucose 4-epimerase GalE [Alphaproteobacteria bacterium]